MSERTFDLTIPVTRPMWTLWRILGVLQICNGLFFIVRGNHVLGGLSVAVGILLLVPFRLVLLPLNRYTVRLGDESLEIRRGLFGRRVIPWSSITKVKVALMSVEFEVNSGKSAKINFGEMGYTENQTLKPEISSEVKSFAERKGIEVVQG